MVFKKDLTPLSLHRKGEIHKHEGKGAREQEVMPPSARFPGKKTTLHPGALHKRDVEHYGKDGNPTDGVSGVNPTTIDDNFAAPAGGGNWGGDSM